MMNELASFSEWHDLQVLGHTHESKNKQRYRHKRQPDRYIVVLLLF